MAASEYLDEITAWREQRDLFFKEHYATPLSDAAIVSFAGLDYFDVDETLVVRGSLSEAPESSISVDSSTGSVSQYPVAGIVDVVLPGGMVEMFIADIGQNAVEEINLGTNGGNFGWNQREGILRRGKVCLRPDRARGGVHR